jgi:hypothetical protein
MKYTNIKVDREDKDLVREYAWFFVVPNKSNRTGYFKTKIRNKTRYLHRLIMKRVIGRRLFKSERVDHINRDGTNNKRSNLRLCTHRKNMLNMAPRRGVKFKGVTYSSGKWVARISPNNKTIYLGRYEEAGEAAKAYNEAAIKYYGDYAYLNQL